MKADRHGPGALIGMCALFAVSLHLGCSCGGRCGPGIDCAPSGVPAPRDFPDASLPRDASNPVVCADYGAPCDGVTCESGLTCRREVALTVPGDPPLEVLAFPGGLCTQECDPADRFACPVCTVCVPHVLAGRAELAGPVRAPGVCRPRCTTNSDCGEGYACDDELGACVERCTSDAQCAFVTIDGALVHEPDAEWICGPTGRCVVRRECASAEDECDEGMECQPALGVCSHRCERGACPDGLRCATFDGEGWCVLGCVVGAEPPEDRVGSQGHGAGCPVGLACTTGGVCQRGNYNDVLEPDLGEACTSDAECWSPFGRGACFRATAELATGVCVLSECMRDGTDLWPGVDVPDLVLCDPERGDACVQHAPGASRCMRTCETAEACAPGHACIEPWQLVPRVCASHCVRDGDCREDERCRASDGLACVTSGGCTCTPVP